MTDNKTKTLGQLEGATKYNPAEMVDYAEGSVVSRTLVKNAAGTITLFSFDEGQNLSEHSAPFDAIVVTAASEHVPPALVNQLKDGGRMVIPVGSPFYTQSLILVEKQDGRTRTRNLMAVRFVPMVRNR